MFPSDSHVSMRSNKMDKSTFLVWSSWWSLTPKPFHVELVKPFISKDWCCAHLDMMRWNFSTLKIDLNFNFWLLRKASQIFIISQNDFHRHRFSSSTMLTKLLFAVFIFVCSLFVPFLLPFRAYCSCFGVVLCALNTN